MFSLGQIIAPAKSIAVLPFENLSANPETAFFTDGIHDEILSDLAKVADLKVISRTSVMQYITVRARNLPEIARQLGVAHILEGSVQRIGDRFRINAQLIEARTDTHLWAQVYDRDIADVFAIQSEIAKTIAEQLQAKLSPREKASIAEPPRLISSRSASTRRRGSESLSPPAPMPRKACSTPRGCSMKRWRATRIISALTVSWRWSISTSTSMVSITLPRAASWPGR